MAQSALFGEAWGVGFTPSRSPQQSLLGARFTETANFVQLVVRHVFDADKGIVGAAYADKFVKLDLDGGCIRILRVLNQKHHQEGDDRRPCIDDELPSVGETKERTAGNPDQDGGQSKEGYDLQRVMYPGPLWRRAG
jgi:hypothetical protein